MAQNAHVVLTSANYADVYDAVFPAQGHWRPLGERLRVEGFKLNGMRGSLAGGDDAECLRQVVTLWLKKRRNNPTWAMMVAALRHETVGDEDVADILIQNYLGGIDPEGGDQPGPGPRPEPVGPPPGRPAPGPDHEFKLDQTPDLYDFEYLENSDQSNFINVIDELGGNWTRLPGYFQLPAGTAATIQATPGFGPAMACREVFDTWLRGGTRDYRQPKTWRTVISGIERVIRDQPLADRIRDILTT